MSETITGVLVDVAEGTVERCETDGTLEDFYKLLNCSCIDIATRKIDGKTFDFVCDDEGLLKTGIRVSAIGKNREPMLVGNLFICSSDEDGATTSITDEDIDFILGHVAGCISGMNFWSVISHVEYC